MISLQTPCSLGAEGAEYTMRSSSSQDEILTPTNFNIKSSSSSQGSATWLRAKVDQIPPSWCSAGARASSK
jgi:hypothetical protein